MPATLPVRPILTAICLPLLAVGLTACATTTSVTGFKGEEREAAQTVSNLQADATAGEEKKICAEDLAAPLVVKLGGAKACEAAIKSQLGETDGLEVTVHSVQLSTSGGRRTAVAQVSSIYSGKSAPSKLTLAREAGKWRISGLQ